MWTKEVENKSTMKLYKLYKKEIMEIDQYENTEESQLIERSRTNSIQLNWRNRFKNQDTTCPACNKEEETLEHFLLHCEAYTDIRNNFSFVMQPYLENTNEIISDVLLFKKISEKEVNERKTYVKKLWYKRKQKISATQQQRQTN